MDTKALMEHFNRLGGAERRVLVELLRHRPIARDVNAEFAERTTFGERLADRVASFGGSWRFILIFLGMMTVWMFFNSRTARPFDPFPFILLNLVLSCVASLQAPVIMMSQNRQSARDRLDARHDYEVNLKSELEVVGLHVKIDELRASQWSELITLQEKQVALLEEIRRLLDSGPRAD